MDGAAPPQCRQVQRAVRVEGSIDEGGDGAGHSAAPLRSRSEPVADLSSPSVLRTVQRHTEHAHQGRRCVVAADFTHPPGELAALVPAIGHDLLDEELRVTALVAAGDEGPLLDVGLPADLRDAVDVLPSRSRQDESRQISVGGHGHLKGIHGRRC